jgi:hypothetical protein
LEIQIRMTLPEDASAIASVLSESFAEYETFYTTHGFGAITPTLREIFPSAMVLWISEKVVFGNRPLWSLSMRHRCLLWHSSNN